MISKSKFLRFMTKVNPNNGSETNSYFFPWDIFKSKSVAKYENISLIFVIGIFQFNCKSEHKQVKRNKIKRNMSKLGVIFPY